MNDHKKEETMLPDWMCSGETYVPSKDKEAFLTKSTKSVLSVLAKMRFYEGKDGKFSATPSLKLFVRANCNPLGTPQSVKQRSRAPATRWERSNVF